MKDKDRTAGSARNAGEDRSFSGILPHIHGKGAILFTGPNGLRDHKIPVVGQHYLHIGDTEKSPQTSNSVRYLWRCPTGVPFPTRRYQCPGEIGWSATYFSPFSSCNSYSLQQNQNISEEQAAQDLYGTFAPGYFGETRPGLLDRFAYETDSGIGRGSNDYSLSPTHKLLYKRNNHRHAVSSYGDLCRYTRY